MPNDVTILAEAPPDPPDFLPVPAANAPETGVQGVSVDLVVALAARGFVILTGQSGTGKSRSAIQLGQEMDGLPNYDNGVQGSAFELIPVGADWTDARPLVGYRNPFGSPRQAGDGATTNLTYEIPDCLRLLLRSASPAASGSPYMLILDEMNLSHVERYFSPFLSLIEANRSTSADSFIPLLTAADVALVAEVLHAAEPNSPEAVAAQDLVADGRGVPVPTNLMIVGTVNVDETTYMFSPKVLDRAHVIEMRSVTPSTYLENQAAEEGLMPVESAFGILSWATECRSDGMLDQHPTQLLDAMRSLAPDHTEAINAIEAAGKCLLDGAYSLLQPVGFGFGYRVVNEFFAYLLCWVKTRMVLGQDLDGWQEALDRAFIQKILPKIHGNRRQLGESLQAVAAFLQGLHAGSTPPAQYRVGAEDTIGVAQANRLDLQIEDPMPRSREKLASMHRQLQASGYVTFIR